MARIVVTGEPRSDEEPTVVFMERVRPADLESDHFAAQLCERLRWAVLDAAELEAADQRLDGAVRLERELTLA